MLRRQPEKLLLNAAEAAAIAEGGAGGGVPSIAVIPQFGEVACTQLVSWTQQCKDDGQAKDVNACFEDPAEGCECPSCISLEIIVLPDLTLYTTDETFEVRRIYEYCSPNGGPIVLADALADLADQITNDLYFTGTATYEDDPVTAGICTPCTTPTGAIVITGHAGQDYDVYSADTCTIEVVNAFTRPYLTETDLKRLFPIKPGAFGSSPARDKIACGIDYCVDILVIKHEDVQDIDSTNVENYLEEVYIYSPANGGGTSSEAKDAFDALVVSGDFSDGTCVSV